MINTSGEFSFDYINSIFTRHYSRVIYVLFLVHHPPYNEAVKGLKGGCFHDLDNRRYSRNYGLEEARFEQFFRAGIYEPGS